MQRKRNTHFQKNFYSISVGSRFTINAQEPIIIASKTKEVKIKFTNYTHDRLRDKVYFKNEYLESDTQFVSLVTKDSEHELKFKLNWKKKYLIR